MKNQSALRRCLLLMIIMALLLPVSASAMTQVEWNRTCRSKTKGATTMYEQILLEQGEQPTDFPQYEWRAIGTLPANTYVKVHGDIAGYRKISYWKDGNAATCYIAMSPYPLVKATVYVQVVMDGSTQIGVTEVPEAYMDDKAALRKHIQDMYPGTRLLEDDEKDHLTEGPGDSLHLPNNSGSKPNTSSANKKPSSASSTDAFIVRYGDDAVELVQLGTALSIIRQNGEEKEVPTKDLDFGSTAEKDKQVAVIHAPKTGKCTLRNKASESGKMVKNCKAGRIVMVLEYGKSWCKILYNGATGYVMTSCLKFYGSGVQPEGKGLLSYNGKTTGRTTINVRNAPKGDSAKVAQWETGTEVTILGLEKGWYQIESKGIHGFVMEKYLTPQE